MPEKEYIEREALIKTCEEIIQIRWNETTAPVSWSHAYADFIEDIENQPSADVAPVVHSKWEICCDGYYPYCKNFFKEPQGRVMTDYCTNCGAKMDGNKVE